MGRGNKKRPRQSPEHNRQVYYDRLVFKCRKELHKQIKVCKAFEVKKIVRRLKDQPSEALQVRLQQLKATTNLETVVDECFRRLGIVQLNPSYSANQTEEDNDDNPRDQQGGQLPLKPASEKTEETPRVEPWISEKILQHKKVRDSLENWNNEVTEYRRWVLREQDWKEGRVTEATTVKKRKKKGAEDAKELTNSLFVQLGDGDDHEEEQEGEGEQYPDGNYGPASMGGFAETKKKNRKGQRARRAKAQAIEARREGRTVDQSINWRPKKEREEVTHEGGGYNNRIDDRHPPKPRATASAPQDDASSLHPSWQARKAQATGIVSFEGKKITF